MTILFDSTDEQEDISLLAEKRPSIDRYRALKWVKFPS